MELLLLRRFISFNVVKDRDKVVSRNDLYLLEIKYEILYNDILSRVIKFSLDGPVNHIFHDGFFAKHRESCI